MKRRLLSLTENPLLAGSLVMLIGSNFSNFGQFVYHFIIGRMLGKVYYGDLAALISIIGIIGIVQLSVGLTIVKFISSSKNKKEISNFAYWFNKWALIVGGIGALLILLSYPLIVNFLHLHQPESYYLMTPLFFFMVVVFAERSILQGLLSFNKYVTSLIAEIIVKIIFSVFFIYFGFRVFGGMLGMTLGILCAFIVTFLSISPIIKAGKSKPPKISPLFKYSLPVFAQGAALTSMYSADLLLVKHFFSAETAGIYASLAVLGRIVFFGAYPISQVMFPLIAKRFSHGEPYHKIFYLSAVILVLISLGVTVFYIFFPEFIIQILFGSQFIEGAPLLWWFGAFMGFLGLSSMITQFYLSIGKVKVVWLFVIAAILQIFLIWFIHPSILTVIQMSILSAALLTICLVVYFPYHERK